MASRRCAEWRYPTEKQVRSEDMARRMNDMAIPVPNAGLVNLLPDDYRASVLSDPRAKSMPAFLSRTATYPRCRGTSCAYPVSVAIRLSKFRQPMPSASMASTRFGKKPVKGYWTMAVKSARERSLAFAALGGCNHQVRHRN
jgi:hypothetical protein